MPPIFDLATLGLKTLFWEVAKLPVFGPRQIVVQGSKLIAEEKLRKSGHPVLAKIVSHLPI